MAPPTQVAAPPKGSISVGWLWVSFLKRNSQSWSSPSTSTFTLTVQALISLRLVDIGHDAGLLKVLGADGAHVHEADGLGVATELVAHLHVAVEGLLHHGVVDRHVVQDGAEGGVAAVIGPVGVDHADLGDGGVAILIAEVLLAEGDVRLVHGKAALGDKGGKAGLIELAEAVEHLDGLGLGGAPCAASRAD